jgi:hypothetical protein
LVAPTSSIVFSIDLATIENNDERNKMGELQRTWNCLFKQYLRSIYFFVNIGMRVLHKLKKSRVYTIPSSGYVTYSLDWNIVFKLL